MNIKRIQGIDVSYHQGLIDWKKVADSGIEFAIIRAGYGKNTVDKRFSQNIVNASNAGLKIGVYWFIYALNEEDAIANADKCHDTISQYKDIIQLSVAADFEYDSDAYSVRNGIVQTKESRSRIVRAFLRRLKSYGYEVTVYANPDYLNGKFETMEYPLWLAWYGATEEKAAKYNPIMFQYTSSGKVPGIDGNVDMDIYYEEENEETEENIDYEMNVIPYSKYKDGNKNISENFKVKEFACKDGSDPVFVSMDLVELLQKIRNYFGKAVIINSGFRTANHNQSVNGATYSQHLYGAAADIRIDGVSPKEIADYAETLIPNSGGIGLYSNFVHVDVRKNRSRWNG